MATDPLAPADTNMMRIVHDALRRDLRRARATLASSTPLDDRRRAALAEHLTWMMAFLDAHHRSEDVGLYPVVRERDPGAAPLLDDMARDHETVAQAILEVDAAAAGFAETGAREPLLVALDGITDVLIPHLQREEDEVMPVVERVVTDAEWRAIEQEHNLDGKSMSQLGRDGHWLIDEASPEDRERVLALVPPVARLLLLYGFGPSYRRHARACWRPPRDVQRHGRTSVVVAAGMDEVWELVRDPTRVGEWSHECVGGEWVGEVTEARPGARFRGRNRQGLFRWGRLCEVVRAEPYELVWRTVPTRLYPDSTEWALRLSPAEGGTCLEQTFDVVKATNLARVYAMLLPAHRDRTEALRGDLERIGALAVGAPPVRTDRSTTPERHEPVA